MSKKKNSPVPFKAPFPYFGGKSQVTARVWSRFGEVRNYVEPFFGSGAMLLGRPGWTPTTTWIETVNDKDGMIANFWRAVKAQPQEVAANADWPVNENDLHARHIWLVNQRESLVSKLEGDADYFDTKIAGWWVWGISQWIGRGFCSGRGAWSVVEGQLTKRGVEAGGLRQLPHLGNTGEGVMRRRVALGSGKGITRKSVPLSGAGKGINRQRVHLTNRGQGVTLPAITRQMPETKGWGKGMNALAPAGTGEQGLYAWFEALSARLRRVRVCSGDWSRLTSETVTTGHGLTAVFLDPPYSKEASRDSDLYAHDDLDVAHKVREWALANGTNPLMRIALCGYTGEHDELEDNGWSALKWKAQGGMSHTSKGDSRGKDNAHREVVWFSPHCLPAEAAKPKQLDLFAA